MRLVLIGLPGLLTQFEDYRLLIYGATLIAVMLLRPQGLIPNVRRSRELQEDERSQDQWAKHLLEADAYRRGRSRREARSRERAAARGVQGGPKHFGGLYALNGLDLHVNEHEIVSVIGPNGAGKSTRVQRDHRALHAR